MKKIKKTILIIIGSCFLAVVLYYGIFRNGFRYFTGLGTPYNYFQAQKATNDSILIFYEHDLVHTYYIIGADSLKLQYGFKYEYADFEVSYSVMNLYNSIIRKELMRRLGESRWNEYLSKTDSLEQETRKQGYFLPW